MKREAGLWIDHRDAVIVFLSEDGEKIQRVLSNVEKHIRYSRASHTQAPDGHNDAAEDIRDRRYADHLNKYYDEVIRQLHEIDFLLIIGPGEAKLELQKRLQVRNSNACIVILEARDKLTDPQLVAQVRHHFRG